MLYLAGPWANLDHHAPCVLWLWPALWWGNGIRLPAALVRLLCWFLSGHHNALTSITLLSSMFYTPSLWWCSFFTLESCCSVQHNLVIAVEKEHMNFRCMADYFLLCIGDTSQNSCCSVVVLVETHWARWEREFSLSSKVMLKLVPAVFQPWWPFLSSVCLVVVRCLQLDDWAVKRKMIESAFLFYKIKFHLFRIFWKLVSGNLM